MTDPTTYEGWLDHWDDLYSFYQNEAMLQEFKRFAEGQLALEANDCNRSRLEVIDRLIERKKSGL